MARERLGMLEWRCRRGMKELDFLLCATCGSVIAQPVQRRTRALSSSFSNCRIPISRVICSRAMSPTIPARSPVPRTPAIRLSPRPRGVAAILAAWLAAFCVMVLAAVDLALLARIGICAAAILGNARAIHSTFLLAGCNPVWALRWDESNLFVVPGRFDTEVRVTLAPGSFDWGRFGMLLRLRLRRHVGDFHRCRKAGRCRYSGAGPPVEMAAAPS